MFRGGCQPGQGERARAENGTSCEVSVVVELGGYRDGGRDAAAHLEGGHGGDAALASGILISLLLSRSLHLRIKAYEKGIQHPSGAISGFQT